MKIIEWIKWCFATLMKAGPWLKWVLLAAGVLLVVKILFFDVKVQGYFSLALLKQKSTEIMKKITDLDGEHAALAKENEQLKLSEKTRQWKYSQLKTTYEQEVVKIRKDQNDNLTNVMSDQEIERQLRVLENDLKNTTQP